MPSSVCCLLYTSTLFRSPALPIWTLILSCHTLCELSILELLLLCSEQVTLMWRSIRLLSGRSLVTRRGRRKSCNSDKRARRIAHILAWSYKETPLLRYSHSHSHSHIPSNALPVYPCRLYRSGSFIFNLFRLYQYTFSLALVKSTNTTPRQHHSRQCPLQCLFTRSLRSICQFLNTLDI